MMKQLMNTSSYSRRLLRLALNLDYADEIGRRRLEQLSVCITFIHLWKFVKHLAGHMISQEALPSGLVTRCLDVLRTLSSSERDLIRVVVEVVHELRDANDDDEVIVRLPTSRSYILSELITSRQNELINDDDETAIDGPTTAAPRAPRGPKSHAEMTAVERERADAMDVRCLDLCIGMLERVNGVGLHLTSHFLLTDRFVHADIFEENSTLEGILGELIVPAVKRKELYCGRRDSCVSACAASLHDAWRSTRSSYS
jgi:condensin complex subunit 3